MSSFAMVCLAGVHLESRMLFLARSLEHAGVPCEVYCERPEDHVVDADEADCLKWIQGRDFKALKFVHRNSAISFGRNAGVVFVRGSTSAIHRSWMLNAAKDCERKVVVIRFALDSWQWQLRQIVKEVLHPFYAKFDRLWTEDVHLNVLRRTLGKRHRFFGALPHQRCSADPDAMNRLVTNAPLGERKYLFASSATENRHREPIALWVEKHLIQNSADHVVFTLHAQDQTWPVVWNYDRRTCSRERNFETYMQELEQSWFCLCLPGHTKTTNRALECLLRGSIPVIQEEQVLFHNLHLKDGINAVFVRNGDWPSALRRLSQTTIQERLLLQQNVLHLAQNSASVESLSHSLVRDLLG